MALDTREPQNSPYKRNPRQITILDPSLRSDQHAATKQTENGHQKSRIPSTQNRTKSDGSIHITPGATQPSSTNQSQISKPRRQTQKHESRIRRRSRVTIALNRGDPSPRPLSQTQDETEIGADTQLAIKSRADLGRHRLP